MLNIGLVAGEPSADGLAAELLRALRIIEPELRATGLGGAEFVAAGGETNDSMNSLAVMGLVEVLVHLPRLIALRRRLVRHFLALRPDVFVGVDAPDFNLDLELTLRRAGIRTIQYVGPSVWAWRRYRLRKIARAVDRVLAVFPFEKSFYDRAGVPCTFVGHPLADRIPLHADRAGARERLGLDPGAIVVALLPGSRRAELLQHTSIFLRAADWIARRCPGAGFVSSLVDETGVQFVRAEVQRQGLVNLSLHVHCRRTHDVLAAADVAIVASGTVTLEAMLFKVPMVVAYRMHPVSYHIIRGLVSVKYAALPNLLSGTGVVPELLQDRCRPEELGAAAMRWLSDARACDDLRREFSRRHAELRCEAGARAAAAVLAVARGG
ncbi:MAG: lipid-A-disaccharide synthase [Gammaproteobacteria bacterium]|nr:lipid-A-disaccharide synthase [Gammaproteobacteria bacterium]